MSGQPGEDPLAVVARLSETVFKHIDFVGMSQDEFNALWDAMWGLSTVYCHPRTVGPSTHSALRLGYYAATDAKPRVPRTGGEVGAAVTLDQHRCSVGDGTFTVSVEGDASFLSDSVVVTVRTRVPAELAADGQAWLDYFAAQVMRPRNPRWIDLPGDR